MRSNRRRFLKRSAAAAAGMSIAVASPGCAVQAERGEAERDDGNGTRLFMNHVGFLPKGPKRFVVSHPPDRKFTILRVTNVGKTVHSAVLEGRLRRVNGDLGDAWVGDFDAVTEEGFYRLVCGELSSRIIVVQRELYDYSLRTLFNYFPSQRCGDSLTGYNAPCHVSDARRIDNGKRVDVTGGWHQSSDCRKWILGTPFGLLGLSRLGMLRAPRWDRGQIDEELRWGNRYFLRMIRADGGLMDHVVLPLGWDKERDLYPNDAPLPGFYLMIVGQAMAAEYFRDRDAEYRQICLDAARRLWDYVTGPDGPQQYAPQVVPPYHDFLKDWFKAYHPTSSLTTGDRLYAAVHLYRATGEKSFLTSARADARRLVALQVGGDVRSDPLAACFRESADGDGIAMSTYYGFFGPLGLCELVESEESGGDGSLVRDTIGRIAEQYHQMAEKNPWGLIPSYWYAANPGRARPAGSGFYAYFYNSFGFRIGVNHEILGKALFLLRASRILKDRRFLDVACRQVDWILGCNPFDASTVEGVGYNQPSLFLSCEFFPPTPQIPGAVKTGIVGDDRDEPVQYGGVATEYDMPPTSLLMWFLSELPAATEAV